MTCQYIRGVTICGRGAVIQAAVAQWLRASNIFRQICKTASEWRGFESRWFYQSGFEFAVVLQGPRRQYLVRGINLKKKGTKWKWVSGGGGSRIFTV